MKSRRSGFALLLTGLMTTSAHSAQPAPESLGFVPWPQKVVTSDGSFTAPSQWTIAVDGPQERDVAAFAVSYLQGRGTTVYVQNNPAPTLHLSIVRDASIPNEGYRLHIDDRGVAISATSGSGLFYGLQTLEQLIETHGSALPFIDIADRPRFAWRGIHLDVARHFFPVPVVERYIDVAAHYKLNTFHWHLTDDQGWRIEIKHYPLLTKIGACRAQTDVAGDATQFDGKRSCGYYTQAQIREVVDYASKRFVTIVPEIEMPGHATASIAAYPSLGCGHKIYCPSETTFRFIDTVLGEVAALFPSRIIHTGGNELPKDEWQHSAFVANLMQRQHLASYDAVQGYFGRRVQTILAKYSRRMAGWDEILDGGVSHSATIVAWHSVARGIKAAQAGYDVVMSPDGPLNFDAYQGDPRDEPQAPGGLSRLQDVYAFEPIPDGTNPDDAKHIVGVQANLWTEYIADPSYLFYMLLPRELALSEVAWSQPKTRDWTWFEKQSIPQYAWLERNGFNFRIPNPQFVLADAANPQIENVAPSLRTSEMQVTNSGVTVSLRSDVSDATIHYTMDGTMPTAKSSAYTGPFAVFLRSGGKRDITAVCILADGRISTPTELILKR